MNTSDHEIQSVNVVELNGVPFNSFDFMNRDHHLTGEAFIDYMHLNSFVGVDGQVNGYILEPEYENTLMVSFIQLWKQNS